MDNHQRRVLHKMDHKKRVSFLVDLVRKSIMASERSEVYEIDMSYTNSTYFEFRIYRKGETSEILLWETIQTSESEFYSKAKELNRVLNHLLSHGIMPDLYNFYLSNPTDK